MDKNYKIMIGVAFIILILIIGLIVAVGIFNSQNVTFEEDIVGQGNPGCSFDLYNSPKPNATGYATVFQWFDSKSGKEYKNVKIRIDLYKNNQIIASKDVVISSLGSKSENIFQAIDVSEEPDYATTTVINATTVNN